jgi:hypothetical protein
MEKAKNLPTIVLHTTADGRLFVYRHHQIQVSHGQGLAWQSVARFEAGLDRQLLGRFRLSQRLFRLGVQDMALLADGAIVCIAKGMIYRAEPSEGILRGTCRVARGSRPLFLCHIGNNTLFWGEYFGNVKREALHIYGSDDGGRHFEPVYTFPAGSIRHVHGLFYDPYGGKVWITTGDFEHEAAIWVADGSLQTLQQVTGGSQQQRVMQLLFTKRFIYYGTDTPQEQNYLYRLEKKTGQIECLQAVDSSVFYGCLVGHYLFFSTAVEPSRANPGRDACIWGSADGENWQIVARFRKDIWSMKYFQYGQIRFPSGQNQPNRLWFTPLATEYDQTVQSLTLEDLFENVK